MPKPKIALILGAGFSTDAGLPTTPGLSECFLSLPSNNGTHTEIEDEISAQLGKFWHDVFGYDSLTPKRPPLEDHFTLIDLAANSGHQLGPNYNPRRLRAIRRLSIHRVFEILDLRYRPSPTITALLADLANDAETTIISTNWDVVVEKHLHDLCIHYNYGSTVEAVGALPQTGDSVSLLKLHGSANWVYCDSCRTLFSRKPSEGKAALHLGAYLEPEDFVSLGSKQTIVDHVKERASAVSRKCHLCGARLAARVGTFSYRKDYAIQQFQTIWHTALKKLRESEHWLFIGYSMPEADFEFKQILKSAQLGRRVKKRPSIKTVLKADSSAADRYRQFFGVNAGAVNQGGLADWFQSDFPDWFRMTKKPRLGNSTRLN